MTDWSFDDLTAESLTSRGSATLSKASGHGVLIGADAYSWRDIIGDITPKVTGAGSAALGPWMGGSTRAFFYDAGDICDMVFHVPHDYAMGSDLFLHLHWGHNGTAISGQLVVTYGVTYAKGHNQSNFGVEVAPVITVSTPDIDTVPQYRHRVDEIQLSAASPSATQIDTDDIEPDGLLIVSLAATTIPTITGGTPKPAFFTSDLHYLSTNIGTSQKSPNPTFWS